MNDVRFHTIQYQKPSSKQDSASANSETVATQHPIFIFPGISGNKSEVLKLGEVLSELNEGKRLINIYLGQQSPQAKQGVLKLMEEAKIIADKLSEAPSKRFHFLLVGYSYGCIIAVLVALYLQAAGHIPHLVLIDSPAPEVMKNYFTSAKDAQSATADLISVMQYVAKLCSLETVNFEKNDLEKIATEDVLKRIAIISKFILDHQSKRVGKNSTTFKQYQESIKQKFQNILELRYESLPRLGKINLLLTDKTANKFKTTYGGWHAHADEVHLIPTDKDNLSTKEHTQLLVDETSCTAIAKLIHEIFIEDVLLKEMNIFLTDYSESHKDTNIDYDRILNKLKQQLSEKGLLISFREQMDMEGLNNIDDLSQKPRDGIKPVTTNANLYANNHFGLFCNDIENIQKEDSKDRKKLETEKHETAQDNPSP